MHPALLRWLPPVLLETGRTIKSHLRGERVFATWQQAVDASDGGYASELVNRFRLDRRCLNPGAGLSDRNFDLLLLCCCLIANPRVEIIDFGGAFGEASDRVFHFFPDARFTVVENARLVELARDRLDGRITFSTEMPSRCDIFLTSSALHYVAEPLGVLRDGLRAAGKAAIFVRNSFSDKEVIAIRRSTLFLNGAGEKIPTGYRDVKLFVPHRTIREHDILRVAEEHGFALIARIPAATDSASRGGATLYGANLVLVRIAGH